MTCSDLPPSIWDRARNVGTTLVSQKTGIGDGCMKIAVIAVPEYALENDCFMTDYSIDGRILDIFTEPFFSDIFAGFHLEQLVREALRQMSSLLCYF
jgi:hypothetical protein